MDGSAQVNADGELVLRPVTGRGAPGEVVGVWVLSALVTLLFAPIPVVTGHPLAIGMIVVLPVVLGVLGWRSLRARGIVVTHHEIVVRGLLFRRRGQRGRAASVVRARVIQPRAMVFDTVYVRDAGGHLVVRVNGQHYARADMDRLVAFLGVPWSGPDTQVRPSQLDAMYPGVVPWHEAHPYQFGMLGAAVGLVLSIVLAVVIAVGTML